MNYSILQNFKKSKLILEPFPHIIIENCLDDKLYNQLEKSFFIHLINKNQIILGVIYIPINLSIRTKIYGKIFKLSLLKFFLIEVLKLLKITSM